MAPLLFNGKRINSVISERELTMKYDKRQKTKAETEGFTLVEIVAVLVLLGILAAVAVPKFFDLSSDAEKKAAEAALMEAQVRINAGYSKAVYAGSTCEAAVKKVNTLALIGDAGTNKIGKFEFKLESGDEVAAAPGTYVTLTAIDSKREYEKLGQLFVPTCDGSSTGDSGTTGGSDKTESGLVCPDASSNPQTCSATSITCEGDSCTCSCVCNTDGSTSCKCETSEKPVNPDPSKQGECALDYYLKGYKCVNINDDGGTYVHGTPFETIDGVYILAHDDYYGDKSAIEEVIKNPTSDSRLVKFNPNKDTIRTAPQPGQPWNPKLKRGDLFWVDEDIYIYVESDAEWENVPPKGAWVKIITKTLR